MMDIKSPITGWLMGLESVPDKVFASRMLGEGVAIDPEAGLVVSPIDGEVAAVFPTGHAVALKAENGLELLIHVGVDTVNHKEAFRSLVNRGDHVRVGDPLLQFDIELLRGKVPSLLSPVVVTRLPDGSRLVPGKAGHVVAGRQEIAVVTDEAGKGGIQNGQAYG